MDKSSRRQHRKEKDRERKRTLGSKPFDHTKGNYRDALLRLFRHASNDYPSLFKIVELDSQLRLGEQESLDYCGLGDWTIGKAMDTEAIELHTHGFACHRLMAGNYVVPLAMYIDLGLEQLAVASVASISRAAVRFKQSALYNECLTFIGPLRGTFASDQDEAQPVDPDAHLDET